MKLLTNPSLPCMAGVIGYPKHFFLVCQNQNFQNFRIFRMKVVHNPFCYSNIHLLLYLKSEG